jgi:hypothetical protein
MTSNNNIVGTMTIQDAVAHWSELQNEHLERWAETFLVPLQDLHIGHVRTYQKERGGEVIAAQVDIEVAALRDLLKQAGLGSEIARSYQPLCEAEIFTDSEIAALPEPVRKYIDKLKQEVSHLRIENDRMKNQIRKTNWGRSQ